MEQEVTQLKNKGGGMVNVVVAIIYCIVSFIAWLSVIFSLINKVFEENYLFTNISRAILVYVSSGVLAAIMTSVSYFLVCNLQRII